MNKTEILAYLEHLKSGQAKEKIQFNFLFAEFQSQEDTPKEAIKKPLIFGKYNSEKMNSYPFYKPYSKLFDISQIEKDEQTDV